ncbi:UNVERIFIED_CONTAM: hypothetical protein H355_009818 [Colinus virginianus]|nr:hypothetical protein H355_009818 [Colinus virginianus]
MVDGEPKQLEKPRVCFNRHGMVRKYGLMMCRQCFRERAAQIGFVKVDPPFTCILRGAELLKSRNCSPASTGNHIFCCRCRTFHAVVAEEGI